MYIILKHQPKYFLGIKVYTTSRKYAQLSDYDHAKAVCFRLNERSAGKKVYYSLIPSLEYKG